MKKSILFLLVTVTVTASAQKIVEDKKDDFKNVNVTRTDWNKLSERLAGPVCFVRISKHDTTFFLDVKIAFNTREGFSIAKGSEFILKLANDSAIVLFAQESAMAIKGGVKIGLAAPKLYGTQVQYSLSKENRDKLRKSPAIKYRIYRTDDYEDQEIKEKLQETMKELLYLFPEKKSDS